MAYGEVDFKIATTGCRSRTSTVNTSRMTTAAVARGAPSVRSWAQADPNECYCPRNEASSGVQADEGRSSLKLTLEVF